MKSRLAQRASLSLMLLLGGLNAAFAQASAPASSSPSSVGTNVPPAAVTNAAPAVGTNTAPAVSASASPAGSTNEAPATTPAAPEPSGVSVAEAMAFGQEQVDQVVRDRPQLAAVVLPGSEIDRYLAKAFAAPDLGYRLVWKSAATMPGIDNAAESSSFPDAKNRSYITVDGIWKSGPEAGVVRSAEDILINLVFELNNARGGMAHETLAQDALFGKTSRDDFIQRSARLEYDAWQSVIDFHDHQWQAFCRTSGTADSPARWRLNMRSSFDTWINSYPKTNWYPWNFYGKRFDDLVAYHYPDVLIKAQKGDPAAQADMGRMVGSVGLYHDSLDWFRKAAEQGNVRGELALEWDLYFGVGAPKDEAQAFSWAMKAAQQGDKVGEKTVGWHYENGIGVPADPAQAKIWYDKAAAQK